MGREENRGHWTPTYVLVKNQQGVLREIVPKTGNGQPSYGIFVIHSTAESSILAFFGEESTFLAGEHDRPMDRGGAGRGALWKNANNLQPAEQIPGDTIPRSKMFFAKKKPGGIWH